MDNPTIIKFKVFQKEGKIKSVNSAAHAIGISGSALSLWLKDSYKGNNEEINKKVESWLQLISDRAEIADNDVDFIRGIKNSEMTLNLARLVHLQSSMGLLVGRAGLGKSKALQKYADENKSVIYIEVDTAYSSKVLMSHLHKELGLNGIGHLNSLKEDIIDKLKGSQRFLIIDQAEYLSERSLDLLRTIHDKAGVGILLAGLPKLLGNIKGIGGVHEQIYTRIGAALELQPLQNDDIQKLVNAFIPGTNGEYKHFIEASRRNARVLNILCRETKRIAKNKGITVTAEVINKAQKQLVK